MKAKLYNARHVLSAAAHYGITAAIVAGAYIFAPVWALGAAAALTGGLFTLTFKKQKDLLENGMVRHPESHKFSPNLRKTVESLYKAAGINSKDYPIYDFRVDDSKAKKGVLQDLFREMFNTAALVPNAAAMNIDKPIILISEPLLKLLDDDEEKAVLAHEFTHAAARHQHLGIPQRLLVGFAAFSSGLTSFGAMLATGWVAVLSSIAATSANAYAFRKLHPSGSLMLEKDGSLELRDLAKKKRLDRHIKIVSSVLSAGVLTYFSPVYLQILAAAKTLSISAKITNATFSRSMEYQADRGAVKLGANPLALITSLRKITTVIEKSQKEAFDGYVPEKSYLLKKWETITASHPTLDRRIGRLSDIARKSGYSESAIEKATKGPLDIPANTNIPYDVIKQMAMRV